MSMPARSPAEARAPQASLIGGSSAADCPPLLAEALERIAAACVAPFEKIAGADMAVTCAVAALGGEAAGEVIASIEPHAVTATFDVATLGARLLVSLDHDFVQLVIELMCGGLCNEALPSAPRAGTSIDRQFARVALTLLASVIEKECMSFGLGPVALGQVESKLDPLVLGKRNARVAVATLAVECRGRRAELRIAFPQTIVGRFKPDSLPASAEPLAAGDPAWTEHFQAEIRRTAIRLDAFLDGGSLTLGEVAALRPGQILALPKTALSRCELRNDGKLLFHCELGQADGRYSLRIDDVSPGEGSLDPAKAGAAPLFPL